MKLDKRLWVLVFICVINSLGFGIIVPLMYVFGKKYGLNEQSLSWLTAAYSVAQLIATPVFGALSDKYGRKPLLAISLIGTCISFIMFAEARGIIMLFAARILDGLTGGNISVAQAIVSDTSTPKDRLGICFWVCDRAGCGRVAVKIRVAGAILFCSRHIIPGCIGYHIFFEGK
jgi:MFS family permease